MDLGGTYASSITLKAYENLKRHLRIEHPTVMMRKWASVVKPDESILRHFDIDTRIIMPRAEEGWVEGWREEILPEGASKDEWGLVRIKPPDGNYFMTNFPLSGEKTILDIARYPWPNPDDPERFKGLKDQATFPEENDRLCINCHVPQAVCISQPVSPGLYGLVHRFNLEPGIY